MDVITEARPFDGWFIRGIVRGRLEAPRTRLPLDEEYWLALRHPAEGLARLPGAVSHCCRDRSGRGNRQEIDKSGIRQIGHPAKLLWDLVELTGFEPVTS